MQEKIPPETSRASYYAIVVTVFLLCAALSLFVVRSVREVQLERQRMHARITADDHLQAVSAAMQSAMAANTVLGSLVQAQGGRIAEFDMLAAILSRSFPVADSFQLAPGGIVRQIYPLAGNERAIGHDLFGDPKRRQEAVAARESGRMILAGPFPLRQGGVGAVLRNPVFRNDTDHGGNFWGFTNILVRVTTLLDVAGLSVLAEHGYHYVLRRSPDEAVASEIIAASTTDTLDSPVVISLPVADQTWQLSVTPIAGWGNHAFDRILMWIAAFVTLLATAGAAALVRYPLRLKAEVAHQTRSLEAASARTEALLTAVTDAVVTTDVRGQIVNCNSSAVRLCQRSREDMLGRPLADILTWDDGVGTSREVRQWINGLWASVESQSIALATHGQTQLPALDLFASEVTRKDGTTLPVELSVSFWQCAEGLYSTAVIRDVSKRRQNEANLRIAAKAFETREAQMITDGTPTILAVNTAFERVTGYTMAEVVGKSPAVVKSGIHDAQFYRQMWHRLTSEGSWQGEIWNRRKNGEVYPEYLEIRAVSDEHGLVTNYVGSFTDTSHDRAAQERIHELSFTDSLTALPNRSLLVDRLTHAQTLAARSRVYGALLMLDLDEFRLLNDSLGHQQGDILLQEIAQRLARSLRSGDTVGRLGGDEFLVIMDNLGSAETNAITGAEAIAEKLLRAISVPIPIEGREVRSKASIGITLFGASTPLPVDELLQQAELAMYRAKATGKNQVRFYFPEMQRSVSQRAEMEAELAGALEQNQLQLYYQPQVDALGRVTGAEALLRWCHPVRGLVSPGDFIPLAEETDLILPIGDWVLDTACDQLVRWQSDPHLRDLTLAVNVSIRQFRQTNFADHILTVIATKGIDPTRLKLELTESLLVDDVEGAVAKMQSIKQRGIQFSLDDFGTGYSSLVYLKRLPIDQLKIDRSFVSDVLVDDDDAAITKTVVALAQNLKLDVIAEGVESAQQQEFLTRSGCHAFQGYLFSRPIPSSEFERFTLRRNQEICSD